MRRTDREVTDPAAIDAIIRACLNDPEYRKKWRTMPATVSVFP